MKKIIIAGIITCSAISLALAQTGSGGAESAKLSSTDINKDVEYTFKKGEDNLIKINEHFFVNPSKKINFVTKFMDQEVNQNIGFQGEDILVSKDIPEGSYNLTVAICEEEKTTPTKEELNKTWEKEYRYFYDEGKKKENNEGEGDGEGGDDLQQDL